MKTHRIFGTTAWNVRKFQLRGTEVMAFGVLHCLSHRTLISTVFIEFLFIGTPWSCFQTGSCCH
ncbi:hypothetical protein [Desulfosporosinus sp. Sb-LF]|uniref:hypothetical protein n=1 Tax=Desulfosporosinus sp. Sb-LF TaxID=2560027 RepID=UPI00130508A7|nr:hypothetical protein [Desulfosporosinus sp. Sb-LF]